jgi:8-oxo-dGTP pyrophosphatase MutT (NUDIX family)
LLRPAPSGFEVFLAQRSRTVGFMPNVWVFPGGRVDAGDALLGHPAVRGGSRTAAHWGFDAARAVAFQLAGVRETFEEASVWLGDGAPTEAERFALAKGHMELTAFLDRGYAVDLDRLAPWAWWITPRIEPKRFDTAFLVARVDGTTGTHDASETVASEWISPAVAAEQVEAGERAMAPPTWWTLRELAAHPTIDAVFAAAWTRPHRPIEPMGHRGEDGAYELRLPGHPEHPEPAIPGLPASVQFQKGRWWADGRQVPA